MQYYDKLVSKIEKDLEGHQNLILLIGLAGCGKTSLAMTLVKRANPQKTTRVCLDSIITMESGYNYDPELRDFYRAIEIETAKKSLEGGYNLVVDDTNITKEIRKLFIDTGKRYRDVQTVGIYFNIPVESCIERRLNDPLLRLRENYSKKNDWTDVIKKQSNIIEEPSLKEGFDMLFELDENSSIVKMKKS
jgi:predicted kinase